MSNKIEVMVLEHNMKTNMPLFLAKLTQRGHDISNITDVKRLFNESKDKPASKTIISLPHSTIKRMSTITIAITGLSTKAVSQLRTHATRMTFVSTSTQYSSFEGRDDNYVLPDNIGYFDRTLMEQAYEQINKSYKTLIDSGVNQDAAGYLLPQGLRKALVIHGNLDAWEYLMSLRMCHRNTTEVQDICKLIYKELEKYIDPVYLTNMVPSCYQGKCKEGTFSCGTKFTFTNNT